MKKKGKIVSNLILALFLALSIVPVRAEENFDTFLDDLFKEYLEEDYMTAHFYVKDFSAAGIETPELSLGENSWEQYAEDAEECQEDLEQLKSYDYNSLSKKQQTDYDSVKFWLENRIALNKYPEFDFAFQAGNGIVDALNTNFTEFKFYTKENFDEYLAVLSSTPDYLKDCMKVTKKQAEEGYFLTDAQLRDTDAQLDKFLEKKEDNPLITTFNQRIDAFEGIDPSEKETYKQKNQDIVLNSYIPAVEKTKKELDALAGSRKGGYAIADLKNGKDYYAAMARSQTGLDCSVQEMVDVCTDFLKKSMPAYSQLLQAQDRSFMDETIPEKTPEEILAYLQEHMDSLPEGPEVNYLVDYLDPSIANDSVVAYYMQPPLDDITDNMIRINGSNVDDTVSLYETLAHEGFPGHLFQTTWYLNENPSPIRKVTSQIGYTEGWAMYAEVLAYNTSELSDAAKQFHILDTTINYVLNAVADLCVNGLGWNISKLGSYFDSLGINGDGLAANLYDFVTLNPGMLLPYGVGISEFMLMRQKAEAIQKDSFDLKQFNTVLLEGGARPFANVEKDVNSYLGLQEGTSFVDRLHTNQGKEESARPVQNPKEYGYWIAGGVFMCLAGVGYLGLRWIKKRV